MSLVVRDLRCEYEIDPIGIDVAKPRLSWKIEADRRGARQTAYQIQVTELTGISSSRPVWDTGKVDSERSTHIVYEGAELISVRRYRWRVRVWDEEGKQSRWSNSAWWEMGLLAPDEWTADWISPPVDEAQVGSGPVPLLRRAFSLMGSRVRAARLYVTSLGLYEVYLNGSRVGDRLFTPGWTSYRERLQYQVYDVAHLLREGENAVGAMLGDGWYRGTLTWESRRNVYGDRLALLAELRVTYDDGETVTIRSDDRWRTSTGGILMSDLYAGEVFDARLEKEGWTQPEYDDSEWSAVEVIVHPRDMLIGQIGPAVRRIEEIPPASIDKRQDGTYLVDFGQNMVGWVRVAVAGEEGATIVLHHGEILDSDGSLYTENLRTAAQEVRYTLKGTGSTEVFEPHFTFQGFRYVSIAGYPAVISTDHLMGIVIHSDVPRAGRFRCSNPQINQLYSNILWSQKGNFVDVPTDCPQRDERLGWTGDAQVFAETAALNMGVAPFLTRWLADLKVDQRPDGNVPHVVPDVISVGDRFAGGSAGWADAAVVVPWVLYRMYGDTRILERQYESMTAWIAYVRRRVGDDLVWKGDEHFGDWLSFRSNDHRRPSGPTPPDLIATAYFAYSSSLVASVARVLGRMADVVVYESLAARIKYAFVNEFVTPAGRISSNTQTAYVLALAFDLLPEDLAWSAAERLVDEIRRFDNHLTTGFLGTPLLLHVLSAIGRDDVAYDLLMQDTYPSWLYPVGRGATTIWEHWDGVKPDGSFQDPEMNSYNHYAYGAVGSWLYQAIAGIRPDPQTPGFRHTIIHPRPGGGLTSAMAEIETMFGPVRSSWELQNERFRLDVVVPPNATATVILPCMSTDEVTESDRAITETDGIAVLDHEHNSVRIEVPSGTFTFSCPFTPR